MLRHRSLFIFLLLLMVGLVSSACDSQEPDEINDLENGWLQKIDFPSEFAVEQIYRTGDGIENSFQGFYGQGCAVFNRVLYRLYDSGLCQTYDLTDIAKPVKTGAYALASHHSSNHSNCAQFYTDKSDGILLYVSGLRDGKTYVERMSETSSSLVQTITLAKLDIFRKTVALNVVCSEDGFLWLFGSDTNHLYFAKARRPLLSEGDVSLYEDDILDYWSIDDYEYSDDIWQGGKVYGNFLFFLFGNIVGRKHLAVYDTRTHDKILDIDLTDAIYEEPEDCDIIPEGILFVTNKGNNYYLLRLRY